jgi:hypothetical protein
MLTLEDLISRRKQAQKEYRTAKKNHIPFRQKYLDILQKKEAERLKKKEEQRQLGKQAKWISGKAGDKNVTAVVSNGMEYTTKQSVEEVIIFQLMKQKCKHAKTNQCYKNLSSVTLDTSPIARG